MLNIIIFFLIILGKFFSLLKLFLGILRVCLIVLIHLEMWKIDWKI